MTSEAVTDNITTSNTTTKRMTLTSALQSVNGSALKSDIPTFRTGDVVRVHAKIVEGNKERIQVFEGIVLKRNKGNHIDATFTVRKVSYNVGVERTFPLHSPRIDKIEVVSQAKVRRARLFYIRPLRGKATRMKTLYNASSSSASSAANNTATPVASEA